MGRRVNPTPQQGYANLYKISSFTIKPYRLDGNFCLVWRSSSISKILIGYRSSSASLVAAIISAKKFPIIGSPPRKEKTQPKIHKRITTPTVAPSPQPIPATRPWINDLFREIFCQICFGCIF